MKNAVYANRKPGTSLPVPAGTKSGDPVKVGSIVGVAATNRADSTLKPVPEFGGGNRDGEATILTDGAYELTVDGTIDGPGTPVYITGTGPFTLTTTATEGSAPFGHTVPGPNGQLASKGDGLGRAVVELSAGIAQGATS